jgi:hypothetical protein
MILEDTMPDRGCGRRKVNGLYLVCDGEGFECVKLPYELSSCPVCGGGVHFARGWTWISPRGLTDGATIRGVSCKLQGEVRGWRCPGMVDPVACPFELTRAGLMWVGQKHYTPESFRKEAELMGISKRIHALPREFVLGDTWVFLAHKKAGRRAICGRSKKGVCGLDKSRCEGSDMLCPNRDPIIAEVPALFYAFKPTRIELVITQSQLDLLTQEQLADYDRRHIDLVIRRDDDGPTSPAPGVE